MKEKNISGNKPKLLSLIVLVFALVLISGLTYMNSSITGHAIAVEELDLKEDEVPDFVKYKWVYIISTISGILVIAVISFLIIRMSPLEFLRNNSSFKEIIPSNEEFYEEEYFEKDSKTATKK